MDIYKTYFLSCLRELYFNGEHFFKTPPKTLMEHILKHISIVAIYGNNSMAYFGSQRK